jgi:hypothetical protein
MTDEIFSLRAFFSDEKKAIRASLVRFLSRDKK